MKNHDMYKYSLDLKSLYVKTKNLDIETLFIKVSQSHASNINAWINPQTAKVVKPALNNPEIFDGLLTLKDMSRKMLSPSVPAILDYFKDNPGMFAIVSSFTSINNEIVDSLLYPYQKIMVALSPFKGDIETPKEKITEDLITIYEEFIKHIRSKSGEGSKEFNKTKKLNREQEKVLMFSGILKKMTNEIKGAATKAGMDRLASALDSGILANANKLQQVTPISPIDPYMWSQAQRLVKAVLGNLGSSNIDVNYNFVKERSLYFVNTITKEDLIRLHKDRQSNMDFSSFMSEDESEVMEDSNLEKKIQTISVADEQLLNPEYLSMISTFFMVFYRNLRS